jgi:phage tail sheath gpL-like
MIQFSTIPSNLLVPFVGVEIDNSNAVQQGEGLPYRVLILGQKTTGGTGVPNTIVPVTSSTRIGELAGRDSVTFGPGEVLFQNNVSMATYLGLVDDNAAGTAATGSIVIAGTATEAGTIKFYTARRIISVPVLATETAAVVAAKLKTELTAQESTLPFKGGTLATATIPLTFNHKGEVGNGYPIAHSWQDGDKVPAGLTVTITPFTIGATNPSLASIIAAMGDEPYQEVIHPYTDATTLTAIETEMRRRFSGTVMQDGIAITVKHGSHGTLTTLGGTRNSPHSIIASDLGPNPITPAFEWAAAIAGQAGMSLMNDPAQPLQTLLLNGVVGSKVKFTQIPERNLLLAAGIATTTEVVTGAPQIERLVTTYRLNGAGAPDPSYRDVTTMMTLAYLRWSFRNWMRTKHARDKLKSNGGRIPAGQAIITPAIAEAEAIAWFMQMEELGLVENRDLFKENLHAERNADVNRLDILLPPDLMNQLIVTAAKIEFRL